MKLIEADCRGGFEPAGRCRSGGLYNVTGASCFAYEIDHKHHHKDVIWYSLKVMEQAMGKGR